MLDVDLLLGLADASVGALQHCSEQLLLAAEVVVDHPLGGARLSGDLVNARASETLVGELLGGDVEDLGAGLLGVPLASWDGRDCGTASCHYVLSGLDRC